MTTTISDTYKSKIDQIANDSARHDAELIQIDRRLSGIEDSITDLARLFNQSQKTPIIPMITIAIAAVALAISIGSLVLRPVSLDVSENRKAQKETKAEILNVITELKYDLVARIDRNEKELEEEIRLTNNALKNEHALRIKQLEKHSDKQQEILSDISKINTINSIRIDTFETMLEKLDER